MGLRCLLGHDFDEPETERERNEEGNEVVVTVREVKTCKRCGEKQVVSENKEITSIDQLRESATGEPTPSEASAGADAEADDEWRTDDLSTGRADSDVDVPEADAGPDDTATAADSEPAPTAESEPTAGAESTGVDGEADPIERGVADIIEQAEKDDDMLEHPPEESASESDTEPSVDEETASGAEDTEPEAADTEDDVPVHPGQRGAEAEESEGPDPESDDGVILDEEEAESPPEEARRQWEEEASPEEVPGKDLSVSDPTAPDGEDAEIIDGDVADQPATEPESESPEPASESPEPASETVEPDVDRQPTDTHSAVESEDAEIMDAGPEPSGTAEPEPDSQSAEAEPQSEQASTEREETEEGHMPWPETPGEDEGHDATEPDGEPADVDFGGGLTPSDADAEESDSTEPEPSGSIDRIDAPEDDRANGHRTETGESDDASAAPTANVDLEQSSRDASMEYYCPECGLTRDVGNSSMRAGDICPECRKGYITEQQKAE